MWSEVIHQGGCVPLPQELRAELQAWFEDEFTAPRKINKDAIISTKLKAKSLLLGLRLVGIIFLGTQQSEEFLSCALISYLESAADTSTFNFVSDTILGTIASILMQFTTLLRHVSIHFDQIDVRAAVAGDLFVQHAQNQP